MTSVKDLDLSGKRCLITGAARGIGAATARRLCEQGAAVVVADLDGEAVSQLAEELSSDGFSAHPLTLDVTDDAAVAEAVAGAARLLGGLDTLVANAAIITGGFIDEVTPEVFRQTLEVNVVGVFLCIRHAVPLMREAGGGAIVCVASQAGLEGSAGYSAYCASKFGVVGMVESLALELTGEGIRVTAVAPAPVDTPMMGWLFEREARLRNLSADEVRQEVVAEYPIGRMAQPVEIANAIVFLASDLASYISGATVPVLGGQVS
jgi:NAD(P)-dependent dehydrogenase (short-subunit alcohol dehydrogenase family)